jgi:triosephosphate isomerase
MPVLWPSSSGIRSVASTHGETDEIVLGKARAAAEQGLLTIICIGETRSQRNDGSALSVCTNQIADSVPARSNVSRLVIRYEPLWSIGSGHLPSPAEITAVHRHISSCLVAHLVTEARELRILYGGSVNPANTAGILQLPEVGGALVGGASLTAADF